MICWRTKSGNINIKWYVLHCSFQNSNTKISIFSIALGQFPLVIFAHSHLGVSVTARGRWSLSSSNVFSACCNARCARASGEVGFRTGFFSFFTPASTNMGCKPSRKAWHKLRFGIFLWHPQRGVQKSRTNYVGLEWLVLLDRCCLFWGVCCLVKIQLSTSDVWNGCMTGDVSPNGPSGKNLGKLQRGKLQR